MDINLIQEEFKKADEQLKQAETDLEKMRFFLSQLEEIQGNIQRLETLYFKDDFIQKLELLEKQDLTSKFWATGQDAIWNVSTEYRSLLVEFLKRISDNIYENTPKFDKD